MEERTYKCRKCRERLFSQSNVLSISGEELDCHMPSQVFVEESRAPPWLLSNIENGCFLKGKLNCPKCNGRVGAFDFVSHLLCQCGKHALPPIRVHSDRVDNCFSNSPPPAMNSRPVGYLGVVKLKREAQNVSESTNEFSSVLCNDSTDEASNGETTVEYGVASNLSSLPSEGKSQTDQQNGNLSNNCDTDCTSVIESDGNSSLPFNAEEPIYDILNPDPITKEEEEEKLPEIDTELLTCAVCLEIFYLPQICQPCEHVFCDPCVRQLKASTVYGGDVKCPLCRVVINSCTLQKDYAEQIQMYFPEEYVFRRNAEKKNRGHRRLPSLPGFSNAALRRRRAGTAARNRNSPQLSILAGVCFVIMITMLGFTIFAVTVGFLSWYLLEIAMDLVVDLTAELSTFFEILRSVIIILCIDGSVKEEYMQSLFNSSSRILMAFAKVIDTNGKDSNNNNNNRLEEAAPSFMYSKVNSIKENMSDRTQELLTKVTQATIANYVVVGGLVTYLLYRLAKYLQTVRAGRVA